MLFCNDYEFGLIQDKTGLSIADILSNTELVLITYGERGANLYFDDIEHHSPGVPPENIADPTGVGDAFRGGFLKGYLHNLSLPACTQMGTLAATYCLESEGPQGHDFTLDDFLARFRSHFTDHSELEQLG
jgi:adenosine kinase